MNNLIPLLIIIPIISSAISLLFKRRAEKSIFLATVLGVVANLAIGIILLLGFIESGFEPLFYKGVVLYHAAKSEFSINFFMDAYSLIYFFVATILTTLISVFSKYYIHREKGYKRFFSNLKFFYLGLVIVIVSGNFETMFIGWEILGVTSFFLIGFYRERYLPVKNAFKVMSLYRIADTALLIGIWISHHYFTHSVNFTELKELANDTGIDHANWIYLFFVPGVFLIAAMVKSAQFPFTSWVPRAMEGPTTSSAIFYSSLSVHIGVFLLIRTSPLWEGNIYFQAIVFVIGLITCILSTIVASVQPTVKTQIAYSATSQIGIMFMEVSLGLYWLAIVHFVCNAFLRSYQLLVSPSILSYRIHDQFFNFIPPQPQSTKGIVNKIKLTFYILGIKEFNLDWFSYKFLWSPVKNLGKLFAFISHKTAYWVFTPLFFIGLYVLNYKDTVPQNVLVYLPVVFISLGLILILKAFVERESAFAVWFFVLLNQLFFTLSIGLNEQFDFMQIHIYLSGIFVSAIIGFFVMRMLLKADKDISINKYQGYAYEHPRLAFIFVIACLGMAGFPITPAFIGEDLMLGHIHEHQYILLLLTVFNLIFDGIVIFRIYSRLFLGLHEKGYHPVGYKSC